MESPSYYAIIPADVRYDTRLSPSEKLMYGEITSLCSKTGECWASNKYFADLYNVDVRTITRWITSLVDYKYITFRVVKKKNSQAIDKRILTLPKAGTPKAPAPMDKKVHTPRQKCPDPLDKNVQGNNTRENSSVSKDTEGVVGDAWYNDLLVALKEYHCPEGESTASHLAKMFATASRLVGRPVRLNALTIKKSIVSALKEEITSEDILKAIAYLYSRENRERGRYAVRVHRSDQFNADKINQLLSKVDELNEQKTTQGLEGGHRI